MVALREHLDEMVMREGKKNIPRAGVLGVTLGGGGRTKGVAAAVRFQAKREGLGRTEGPP